jgi:hypothetical protein
MEETMKKMSFAAVIVALLLLVSASANALSYNSGNTTSLSAGQSTAFSFLSAPGDFTSAKLVLNVTDLMKSTQSLLGKSMTSPPSGEFFAVSGSNLTYLFTTDFHLGKNVFKLNNFLDEINLANAPGGLSLGLLMDRGSISFDKIRLRGTVAPEPVSMALMAAGLVGLPFARRLKKMVSA